MASGNRYHHLGWLHGIDLFQAAFSTQTFARHAHEGFAIGAIAQGAGGYVCRGESMILPAGSLSLLNPEEAHTGHAAAGSVRYNMLYVSEQAVRDMLELKALKGFSEIAPKDRGLQLSHSFTQLAHAVNSDAVTDRRLVVEESIHDILAGSFAQYGREALPPAGQESRAIKVMRALIHDHVQAGQDITLSQIASEVGLSPAYLIRSSKRATGLTPHAHVLGARIARARTLLVQGVAAAQAASEAGFYDQAHLIRHFRRHYGVTPGRLILH
jgi:AraC-like DNA-binding protein